MSTARIRRAFRAGLEPRRIQSASILFAILVLAACAPKSVPVAPEAGDGPPERSRRLTLRSPGVPDHAMWELLVPSQLVDDLVDANAITACADKLASGTWTGCSLTISACLSVVYRGGDEAILQLDGRGCGSEITPADHWLAFRAANMDPPVAIVPIPAKRAPVSE